MLQIPQKIEQQAHCMPLSDKDQVKELLMSNRSFHIMTAGEGSDLAFQYTMYVSLYVNSGIMWQKIF